MGCQLWIADLLQVAIIVLFKFSKRWPNMPNVTRGLRFRRAIWQDRKT
jgi:hypothetical protein